MSDGVYSYVCMANPPSASTPAARIVADPPQKGWKTRRWASSADTNRINRAHWRDARGQSINEDLALKQEILWNRCDEEISENPTVEGVIFTHQTDIVGDTGPLLRVISDSPEYNARLEQAWRTWFSRPTMNPRFSGVSLLEFLVRKLWDRGEYILEKKSDRHANGPVQFRINPINSRRLFTPSLYGSDEDMINGVRVDQDNVPRQYCIGKPFRNSLLGTLNIDFDVYPADLIIHNFLRFEEEQTRGVPWLATSLGKIANGRDYDTHVLESAKSHAANSVYFYTDHPDAEYYAINESTSIEPGTASSCPPGWKPMFGTPTQPGAQYFDYVKERQRDIGRPRAMPLMAVRLDASEHNMAAARYDGRVYLRSLRKIQQWISRETLDECVDEIAKELRFDRSMPPRPENVRYRWVWPVPPDVDPLKESNAERVYLENGTLTYSDACAAHGYDVDEVIEQRQKDAKSLDDAELPPLPTAVPGFYAIPANDNEDEEQIGGSQKTPGRKTPAQSAKVHV